MTRPGFEDLSTRELDAAVKGIRSEGVSSSPIQPLPESRAG